MNDLVANYVAARKRLWQPLGGRVSSEIEVVTEQELRRRRIEVAKQQEADKVREALKVVQEAWLERHRTPVPVRDFLHVSTDDSATPTFRTPTVNLILSAVSDFYKIPVVEILSQCRTARPTRVRQVVCYIARKVTTRSLPEIGRVVGRRDHTTVLHSVRRVEERLQSESGLQAEIDEIRRRLGA